MASRIVRWRAGRSRAPPVSSGSRGSSRASSAAGGRTLTRAAASSMASGRPSSRVQTAATAAALSALRAKPGCHVRRPLDEEPHRRHPGQPRDRRRRVGAGNRRGHRQRRHCQLLLAAQAQALPAGRQHRQPRARGEQVADQGGHRRHQMLAIVQEQQHLAGTEGGLQPLMQRLVAAFPDPQHPGDRRQQKHRVDQRREVHPAHPVGESRRPARRRRPEPAATCPPRRDRSASPAGPSPRRGERRSRPPPARDRPDGSAGPAPAPAGPAAGGAGRRGAGSRIGAGGKLGPGGGDQLGAGGGVEPEGVGQQPHRLGAGLARWPVSSALMPRPLRPARSASSSWLRPATSRLRRSSGPKGTVAVSVIHHPLAPAVSPPWRERLVTPIVARSPCVEPSCRGVNSPRCVGDVWALFVACRPPPAQTGGTDGIARGPGRAERRRRYRA